MPPAPPDSATSPATGPSEAPPGSVKPARPIWRRRLIWTGIVLAALCVIFHAPLLRGVGEWMQQSDPLPEGDYALVLLELPGCSRNFDLLAEWAGKEVEVIAPRPKLGRLMKLGLEKPWGQVDIEQLQARGVENVEIWDAPESRFLYQFASHFEKWLAAHPGKSLVIVHGRLYGRAHARVLTRRLSKENRARIFFSPIDSPEFDGSNWFRTKEGQTAFFDATNRILFDLILGDGELPGPDWDPKAYEEALP